MLTIPGKHRWWLLIAVTVLIADQVTKQLIVNDYALYDTTVINSWLNLTRVHNYGAAFSFLSNAGGWQHPFFITLGVVAVVMLLLWNCFSRTLIMPERIALGLVMSGAAGNVIDRLRHGYVVDFLDAHYWGSCPAWVDNYLARCHWPVFNVADIAITAGAITMIIVAFVHTQNSSD